MDAIIAERWLAHACPSGAGPASAVLSMSGQIKLKRWLPFTATQWIDLTRGFVWAARVVRSPLIVKGSDRYVRLGRRDGVAAVGCGAGAMRASGPDVTRSAAWRFFAESLTWLPGPRTDVRWSAAAPDTIVAEGGGFGAAAQRVTMRLGEDGRLLSLSGPRWATRSATVRVLQLRRRRAEGDKGRRAHSSVADPGELGLGRAVAGGR